MPPVLPETSRFVDEQLQLSFLDLIEIRLIDAFLSQGVSWRELRAAAKVGAETLQSAHPFATFKFKTDGRQIFADLSSNDGDRLVHLAERQQVFRSVVAPALSGVEFDARQAIRWWPLGPRAQVVVDPQVCFGKPVGARSGVPVEVLAAHAQSQGPVRAASWYEVTLAEVRGALKLSKRLAA